MATEYLHCRLCNFKVRRFYFNKSQGENKDGWNKLESHYKMEHDADWTRINKLAEKGLYIKTAKINDEVE